MNATTTGKADDDAEFDQDHALDQDQALDQDPALDWEQVHALERAAVFGDGRGNADAPVGLAFSGGGIRSATFNLGVIQALAELKLLRGFDYLSCVSGGGYIGGWLSAFIHRRCDGKVEDAEALLHSGGEENPAIRFLRSYSNYLTPHASVLSADTLTALATWLRNFYLNIVLLTLALGTAMLLPRLLVRGIETISQLDHDYAALILFGSGGAALVLAMWVAGLNLSSRIAWSRRPFYTRQSGVLWLVVLPSVLSAWLVACGFYFIADELHAWLSDRGIGLQHWAALGALAYAVPGAFSWLFGRRLERESIFSRRSLWMATYALAAGALGGVLISLLAELGYRLHLLGPGFSGPWIVTAVGTALVLKFYSLTVVIHIGLAGRHFSHEVREWWSRLGGWLLLAALVWFAAISLVYIAPTFFRRAPDAWVALGGSAWLASTAWGVLLGRSAATDGSETGFLKSRLASVLPYLFVVGLLALLAWALHLLLRQPELCPACVEFGPTRGLDFYQLQLQEAWNFRMVPDPLLPLFAVSGFVLLVFLGLRIDVNLFSIYHFYRQRLTRCYLGATQGKKRTPHPFTGFDPRDDLKLAELYRNGRCQRPCLIHNTAMNLVAGKQLAWQERRAAAFAFTPIACGFCVSLPDEHGATASGYRPTCEFMAGQRAAREKRVRETGVWLGSAMAISGAAASPNMGYHTSPAMCFLLTVFNVRLGHWSPNPAQADWREDGPRAGSYYLLQELFGHTRHDSPYVYLSDGGHFENLGIYELVRRRCRTVIAVDAGQDGERTFEDLGNAIRKCYADFGVTIEICSAHLEKRCIAAGRIVYPDGGPEGRLLYLKPALVGGEPADLENYQRAHPEFPHQSTSDQWFDESQFESYRKLGHHIGQTCLRELCESARERLAHAESPKTLSLLEMMAEILYERQQAAASG